MFPGALTCLAGYSTRSPGITLNLTGHAHPDPMNNTWTLGKISPRGYTSVLHVSAYILTYSTQACQVRTCKC